MHLLFAGQRAGSRIWQCPDWAGIAV